MSFKGRSVYSSTAANSSNKLSSSYRIWKNKNSSIRKRTIHFTTILLAGTSLFFSACNEDDAAKGKVQLYITDAPVDEENVSGVFLTIRGIEIKGMNGWEATTTFEYPIKIKILDYQNGSAYFLTEKILPAGTYREVRLLLDAPTEQGGVLTNPGCYLAYLDGTTKPLFVPSGAQTGYKVKGEFNIVEGGTVAVTLDFDVRKSIVKAGASNKFLLKPVIRLIANQDAAIIKGTYTQEEIAEPTRVIVYAYKKGTFTADEMNEDESGIRFNNALTSTLVSSHGSFTLAFMASGEYDLIFTAVNESEDSQTLLGLYSPETLTSGKVLTITITSEELSLL